MVRPSRQFAPDERATQGRWMRAAWRVVLVGVVVILLAMLIGWALRGGAFSSGPAIASDGQEAPASPAAAPERTRAATLVAVYGAVLLCVLAFVLAILALVSASRHYRRRLLRKRPPPTPTDDIWSQHRLPEDHDAGDGPTGHD
jgi:uncharacterized integral membrane protein